MFQRLQDQRLAAVLKKITPVRHRFFGPRWRELNLRGFKVELIAAGKHGSRCNTLCPPHPELLAGFKTQVIAAKSKWACHYRFDFLRVATSHTRVYMPSPNQWILFRMVDIHFSQ